MSQDRKPIGMYIHIPYCKAKCSYCSFFSKEATNVPDSYINSLIDELAMVDRYPLETLYIGGGTPSLLSIKQLESIINFVADNFSLPQEITLEVNPESVDLNKLKAYKSIGINRLSIGLQSIDKERLRFLGRIHSSERAVESYDLARKAGFDNISLDLIYGVPDYPLEHKELNTIRDMDPEHISTYCLSIEPNTSFSQKDIILDEDQAFEEYDMIRRAFEYLEHYELSAFSKKGRNSRHNSLYWLREEYLGVGAGASSFVSERRWKNYENIGEYCANPRESYKVGMASEMLTNYERAIEYLMLGLRMTSGLPIETIETFCFPFLDGSKENMDFLLSDGFLVRSDNKIKISQKHLFISDSIIIEIIKKPPPKRG